MSDFKPGILGFVTLLSGFMSWVSLDVVAKLSGMVSIVTGIAYLVINSKRIKQRIKEFWNGY